MFAGQVIQRLALCGQHALQHLCIRRARQHGQALCGRFRLGKCQKAETGLVCQKAGQVHNIMMVEAHREQPQLCEQLVYLTAHQKIRPEMPLAEGIAHQ